MIDFIPFACFFSFIIFQRIVELFIANRNEKWMKQQGAIEFGNKHYRCMVMMHILFFAIFLMEKVFLNRGLSPYWLFILTIFVLGQFLRIWVITSLGRFWNTKIIVLPGAGVVRKGPYSFMKHPNYFVVSLELIAVPVLFSSFYTACLFTVLNAIMLTIRISEEEKALKSFTEYEGAFRNCNRFMPKLMK